MFCLTFHGTRKSIPKQKFPVSAAALVNISGFRPFSHGDLGFYGMHQHWAMSLLWLGFFPDFSPQNLHCLMALSVGIVGHFLTLQ